MTSSIKMVLELPDDLRAIPRCAKAPAYDEELDNVLSILADLCELLGNANGVRFLISGFGHDDWRASVRRELCILLEQLPNVAQELERGSADFSIEFFEQGFWRTLSFTGTGDELDVSCVSNDSWTPFAQPTSVSRQELAGMLAALVQQFCDAASFACPELVAHPWFVDWRKSVAVLARPDDPDRDDPDRR